VELIGNGTRLEKRVFAEAPVTARVDYNLTAGHSGWYALVVEDEAGRKAYTDPIWVTLESSDPAGQR
jgi:hypothetical protein